MPPRPRRPAKVFVQKSHDVLRRIASSHRREQHARQSSEAPTSGTRRPAERTPPEHRRRPEPRQAETVPPGVCRAFRLTRSPATITRKIAALTTCRRSSRSRRGAWRSAPLRRRERPLQQQKTREQQHEDPAISMSRPAQTEGPEPSATLEDRLVGQKPYSSSPGIVRAASRACESNGNRARGKSVHGWRVEVGKDGAFS